MMYEPSIQFHPFHQYFTVSERNEKRFREKRERTFETEHPLLHCIDVPTDDDTLRRVRDDASTTETPRVRAKRKRVRRGERRERRNAGHDDDDDEG